MFSLIMIACLFALLVFHTTLSEISCKNLNKRKLLKNIVRKKSNGNFPWARAHEVSKRPTKDQRSFGGQVAFRNALWPPNLV